MIDPRIRAAIEAHGAQQKAAELTGLLGLLASRRVEHVLEIGSSFGGTLWLWRQLASGTVVSVDIAEVPTAHIEGSVYRVRGDSGTRATRALVPTVPFDLIFIDGDHSDAGVRRDYELYAPLIAPGGLVALHDVAPHTPIPGICVAAFWAELKAREETVEFIDPHPCPYSGQVAEEAGIGVVL